MQADFWQDVWKEGRLGWHRPEAHSDLVTHLHRLCGTLLVPLAGKTHDLRYLVDEGYDVIAVDLALPAVQAVADEQGFNFRQSQVDGFLCFEAESLRYYVGDFFELTKEIIGPVSCIWERAGRVALPPSMRQRYVEHLKKITNNANILLNVLEGEPALPGPPHNVTQQEVLAAHPELELLGSEVLRQFEGRTVHRHLFWGPM